MNIEAIELLYKSRCNNLLELEYSYEDLNNYENFKDIINENDFNKIIKIKHNRQQKRCRTKKHFKELYSLKEQMKDSKIVFISIEPNDEVLTKKEDTYIRQIENWLKRHFPYSILNKDFGEKTGREHYHALAITSEELEQQFHEDGRPKKSNSGYDMYELKRKDFSKYMKVKTLQFEPTINLVDFCKNDVKKTINYLLKLNNHSNKITTRSRVRIIKSPLMKTVFELRVTR